MMPLPLFVYGTLRDPDLLAGVLGRRLGSDAVHSARAPGFRVVAYPGRIYPALVRAPGAAADGLLLTGLTPFERDLLDAYEGEEYRRDTIATILADEPELHEAETYMPAITVASGSAGWQLADWQRHHKQRILDAETATAQDLRRRLLAIRPN